MTILKFIDKYKINIYIDNKPQQHYELSKVIKMLNNKANIHLIIIMVKRYDMR